MAYLLCRWIIVIVYVLNCWRRTSIQAARSSPLKTVNDFYFLGLWNSNYDDNKHHKTCYTIIYIEQRSSIISLCPRWTILSIWNISSHTQTMRTRCAVGAKTKSNEQTCEVCNDCLTVVSIFWRMCAQHTQPRALDRYIKFGRLACTESVAQWPHSCGFLRLTLPRVYCWSPIQLLI